jgi:hypothetical protein
MNVPPPAIGAKGHDRASATRAAPFTRTVLPRSLSAIASNTTPLGGSKEQKDHHRDTDRIIVLQLTDELFTQLQPYMEGLDITITPYSEWAEQEIYDHGRFAGHEKVEQRRQRLTMPGEVYDALVARVGSALDYDLRWQPNEYEPDGFVERVRPLELTNSSNTCAGCPTCGVVVLANRTEIACAYGQVVSLV